MVRVRNVKRTFDIAVSLVALVVLAPVLLGIAVAIRASSGPGVFFRQTRLGLHGKPFQILKFRTMVPNAISRGAGIRVTEDDDRITPIGRFLRKWSLDELPQLINVLRGEMSIVGPRPVLPSHPKPLDQYTERELMRFDVRPGLTGLAQINGRGNISWDEKFNYDIEYVKRQSILLDLVIIWRTILHLVRPSDIYLKTDQESK